MAACREVGSPSWVVPYSHARSSRSWRRAIVAIRLASDVRCMSTSDCSTESCRWAASIARSSSRMRAARSSSRRRSRRPSIGAAKTASPPMTTAMAPAEAPTPANPPVRLASDTTPAPSRTTPTTTRTKRTTEPLIVGLDRPPSDHTIEMPSAIAAAGTMIPSPGHNPIVRQTTSRAAVAKPNASSRRHRSRCGNGGDAGPAGPSVDSAAAPT